MTATGVRNDSSCGCAELRKTHGDDGIELEALEGLPCGWWLRRIGARPWDVSVVSLEAKGPHCILAGHASGQILRLGDPEEFDEEEEAEV